MAGERPRGAHLVGSVPLSGAEEVMGAVPEVLGRWLRRLPDGETGERSNWIRWQAAVLAATPGLEAVEEAAAGASVGVAKVRLRPGRADEAPLRFGPLGYADAARASYDVFRRLRARGVVPAEHRFQVCLPTPLAPVAFYVTPPGQDLVEAAYEARLVAELAEILAAVPPTDLALQWDTAVEFAVLEGLVPAWFPDVEAGIVERLVRLGNRVPPEVELGYHLCYGDSGHKHFVEPADTTWLTRIANALHDRLDRPLHWLHLPVPLERDDEAYFRPLQGLRRRPETELYLGLVHHRDGVTGAERRIAAARRVVEDFGVATECGFGRRPAGTVPDLLRLHAALADPVR